MDMDWIHPWIGLDWIECFGGTTVILFFLISIIVISTVDDASFKV